MTTSSARATVMLVSVHMKVTLEERETKRVLYENNNYLFRQPYEISTNPSKFFDEQGPALDRMSRDFAARLVSDAPGEFLMPPISPQELTARLAKGKPLLGILLLGNDSYLRDFCRRKIVDAYVAEGTRDWGLRKLSAKEDDSADILRPGAQHAYMLAPRQVIFVSDMQAWERLERRLARFAR